MIKQEPADESDTTLRKYTMLFEEGSSEAKIDEVMNFLQTEKISHIRMGKTHFLEMTNKQFNRIRTMRAVAGCGLEQKVSPA